MKTIAKRKTKKKFKLGKLQKAWIKSLKENSERQTLGVLGRGTPRKYQACCLGELFLVSCRLQKKKLPFDGGILTDDNEFTLASYEKYGLRGSIGELLKPTNIKGSYYTALARMNDGGLKWPEIANYIEKHPTNVFIKSV